MKEKIIPNEKAQKDQRILNMLEKDSIEQTTAAQNKALFLLRREEIEEALQKGWKVKSIWISLHKRKLFLGTYDCFTRYVRKFCKNKKSYEKQKSETTKPTFMNKKTINNEEIHSFKFNATPKHEDEI